MISILIPTYNRPTFLKNAIESCLDTFDHPVEILIGDDSKNSSIDVINSVILPPNYQIKYDHHPQALKQNLNVANLIKKAKGDYCLILHDDDYLLPGALSKLVYITTKYPDKHLMIFGKQVVIDHDGNNINSENLNHDYLRTKDLAGLQENPIYNVLRQQVPSNSFLFPLNIAKKINYRNYESVGDACDFDFALRMVVEGKCELYFIFDDISAYRISESSVSRENGYNSINFKYKILKQLSIQTAYPEIYNTILNKDINVLCGYYINNKHKKQLKELYFSSDYPLKYRFTLRGLYHFAMIFLK